MVLRQPLPYNFPLTIQIPTSSNLSLPAGGVRREGSGIAVKVEAKQGPLDWSPIVDLQPVGSFRDSVILRFDPPQAGAVTHVTLQYTAEMTVSPGENVTLYLQDFTGPACVRNTSAGHPSSLSGANSSDVEESVCFSSTDLAVEPAGAIGRILWFEVSQRLVLTYLEKVPARQGIKVVVPSSFGIRIPADGILKGDPGIAIEAFAAEGHFLWTRLDNYLPIGAFLNTTLEYSNPRVGKESDIIAKFQPQMSLMAGEMVTLILPGFDTASRTATTPLLPTFNITLSEYREAVELDPPDIFDKFFWDVRVWHLDIRVKKAVARKTPITVRIPFKFILPANGLQIDDASLQLASNAREGRVLPTAVEGSPPALVFGNITFSSLRFSDNATASMP